jgi:hypothetical protein
MAEFTTKIGALLSDGSFTESKAEYDEDRQRVYRRAWGIATKLNLYGLCILQSDNTLRIIEPEDIAWIRELVQAAE